MALLSIETDCSFQGSIRGPHLIVYIYVLNFKKKFKCIEIAKKHGLLSADNGARCCKAILFKWRHHSPPIVFFQQTAGRRPTSRLMIKSIDHHDVRTILFCFAYKTYPFNLNVKNCTVHKFCVDSTREILLHRPIYTAQSSIGQFAGQQNTYQKYSLRLVF